MYGEIEMKIQSKLKITVLYVLAITFTGCANLVGWTYKEFPKETALDKSYSYDGKVIIIGAGASGLAAAKILESNNIDYQIIEATNRYGGRIKKNETLADFPIDIGAEWIHNLPHSLNRLKGKKGDQLDEVLIPYHLESAYSWNGKEYEKVPTWILSTMFKNMPEYKFKNSTWYDYIDENFARYVKHKIKYNSPVTEINYKGSQVEVTINNGEVYKADRVLVTVPIGVLKNNFINFIPSMNEEKIEAIESIGFRSGFKLAMKFNEKFYPDAIDVETDSGEKVYYDVAFKKDAQSNILGLLSTGSSAEAYYQLGSDQKIVSSVLQELDQIFHGKASKAFSGEYVLENWGQHEFTLGTWAEAFLSEESIIITLNEPLDNKIFFAGEVYDVSEQLGVHAAIMSGYHSIDTLLTN